MDITVTFPAGRSGQQALVRFKRPGAKPEFRAIPLSSPPHEQIAEIEAIILEHLDGTAQWQTCPWEA